MIHQGNLKLRKNILYPTDAPKEGTNMISAEVYQDGEDSSDLWFEMSMKAVTEVPEIIDYTKTPIPNPNVPVGEVSRVVVSFYGDAKTSRGFTWYTSPASAGSDLQVIERTLKEPKFEHAITFTGNYQKINQCP